MDQEQKKQVSIVIPVYNEQARIGQVLDFLLDKIKSWPDEYEIIVVDDASSDATTEIVQKHYDVKLISHQANKGYGAALKTGIQHAKFGIIAIADGDGTYPVDRIAELASHMDDLERPFPLDKTRHRHKADSNTFLYILQLLHFFEYQVFVVKNPKPASCPIQAIMQFQYSGQAD